MALTLSDVTKRSAAAVAAAASIQVESARTEVTVAPPNYGPQMKSVRTMKDLIGQEAPPRIEPFDADNEQQLRAMTQRGPVLPR